MGGESSTGGAPVAYSSATGGMVSMGGAWSTAGSLGVGGSGGGGLTVAGGISILTPDLSTAITTSVCASWSSQVEASAALVEFVIDTSGSMNDIPTGSTQSKWTITQQALSNAAKATKPLCVG